MKSFYFINYIESEVPPHSSEECINLNEVGWLYVGSAPYVEGLMGDPNTFPTYKEALAVLFRIKSLLGYLPKGKFPDNFEVLS